MGFGESKTGIHKLQKKKRQTMKMIQNNKLKMAQTTLGCLQHEDNAPLWAGIIGIVEAIGSLETTVDAILARSQKQSARTGFSAQKEAAKADLLQAAFTVCSGLKALASAGGISSCPRRRPSRAVP